jgi:hypothetical protein
VVIRENATIAMQGRCGPERRRLIGRLRSSALWSIDSSALKVGFESAIGEGGEEAAEFIVLGKGRTWS